MDDATQKLVDEADTAPALIRQALDALAENGNYSDGGDFAAVEWLESVLTRALEAAQRPPVAEPDNHHNADVCPFCKRNRDERETAIRAEANRLVNEYAVKAGNLALALEAAQRPPVGPEVREEVRAVVGEQLTKAGLDLNGPPYSDDGETQWPVALELRDRLTDALLARFSVPSQPVYDEEKVARWLHEVPGLDWLATTPQEIAAALVTALRGGELTREETNE